MKKPKYISVPFFYSIYPLIGFVGGIVMIFYNEISGAIFCFLGGIFFAVPLIIFRKLFFKKMIIDEEGIKTYYRKTIIKDLKWEDIKESKVNPGNKVQILFTDTTFHTGKESYKDTFGIFVNIGNPTFGKALYKYADKIPVPIKDIDRLPKVIADIFKSNKDFYN